jgi:hypothetical protein
VHGGLRGNPTIDPAHGPPEGLQSIGSADQSFHNDYLEIEFDISYSPAQQKTKKTAPSSSFQERKRSDA